MPRQETNTGGRPDASEWRAPDALLPATIALTELLTTVATKGEAATPEELSEQACEFLGTFVAILAGALDYQAGRLINSAGHLVHDDRFAHADGLRFTADAFRRILPQE